MSHKAIVAKLEKVASIEGADRIQIGYVLGEQVIISKDWQVGMVGVFFQPELQLSEEYCTYNNLYRDSALNRDKEKSGFFEKNRRVRCQPFLKVRSEGFFAELETLVFCMENAYLDLKVGDQFDELNGFKICQKYISEKTKTAMQNHQKKKVKDVSVENFSQHVDTDQFKYHVDSIPVGTLLSFHHKVHGTSARYGLHKVKRKLPKWKEFVNKLAPIFSSEGWEYVAGTRRVNLFEDQRESKEGFHGSEGYRYEVLDTLKPHLEKGMTVYGEIAGFANGKPIMGVHSTDVLKDKAFKKKYGKEVVYKYGCVEGTNRFHVYRISITNEEGVETDFTAQQVEKWCSDRGILHHLEIHPQMIYDGDKEKLCTLVEQLTERPECLTEDYIDPSHVSEGVIIRADGHKRVPKFYKSKSYAFRVLEGIFKENNVDEEDAS